MKYLLSILALAIIPISCERDVDTESISLTDIYGDFELIHTLDVDNTSIDFERGEKPVFSAEFSKPEIWELTITGETSGAQKTITGFSKELNEENAVWDGSTTKFPMFKAGENCDVKLYVPSQDLTLNDGSVELTIKTTKTNEGVLITDFENGNDYKDGWDWFFQSGVSFFNLKNKRKAPQGSYYYKMFGECNWDWLIGMINIPSSAFEGETFGLSEVANNLYFNVLLNVRKPSAKLLIRFREDDNNNGIFEEDFEDEYSLMIENVSPGWQQFSVKYSDLTALIDGNATAPNGNAIHNPDLLNIIDVLLLADPETVGETRVDMDYMIFTENEPLNP